MNNMKNIKEGGKIVRKEKENKLTGIDG